MRSSHCEKVEKGQGKAPNQVSNQLQQRRIVAKIVLRLTLGSRREGREVRHPSAA